MGRSWRAIQSVELGTLPLSAGLAERICEETGVGFEWLMKGDPDAPIVDDRGLRWKRERYFDAQGKKLAAGATLESQYANEVFNLWLAQVCAGAVAAAESPALRTYAWRLSKAINEVMRELPDYGTVLHDFQQMLKDNAQDMKAGRKAMIEYAVKRIGGAKVGKAKRRKGKRRQ